MTNIKLKDAMIASYSGGTDSLFEITLSCTRENVDAVLNEWGGLEVEIKSKDASKQEQPKLPGYDKALLDVKSKVDELYEEASIGLNEYDSGLYNGIAETCMKLRGFIKARLDSDEQPEVDLAEEITRFFSKNPIPHEHITDWPLLKNTAIHFYELGLNARKK